MRRLRLHSLLAFWAWAELCRARQPGFSIHHDLLAYPQFEVVISEAYISAADAQVLLDSPDVAPSSASAAARLSYDAAAAESYEVMSMPPHRYLCAIPVIEPTPALNKTATELAMAEEARELARASAHGWDLINKLDGTCLYYMLGWWSYRFCYGQEVVQFHAIASSVKSGPPMRDVNTAEYILGRIPDPHLASRSSRRSHQHQQHQQRGQNDQAPATPAPPDTDLQVKGDQRYLVQKMGDGTVCDLTGRDRTIEIQYHCSPESTEDRIGWIKEVTTCSYLMMINTPRLCVDVAFRPPKEERANIISCRVIVPESAQADWHARKTLEAQAAMVGRAREAAKSPVVIGGLVIGGRKMLGQGEDGKEAPSLSPPRNFIGSGSSKSGSGSLDKLVEIIASAAGKDEGGQVNIMTEEQLQELDLRPEDVEDIRKEIQEMAGDKAWQLKIVELPDNNRQLVGIIEDDGEGEDDAGGDGKKVGKAQRGKGKSGGQSEEGGKGSEEKFFRDEL
ncbi:glucosidase II beta subunit-like protein-domain-containing protein [Nemania serpens]|nr:glucosidase II beta subunit-like protein-domain-containing protein [Nemania serpens]